MGDPGDDHECPLGCDESMPRSRLWPHVERELDGICSAAVPDVELSRSVRYANPRSSVSSIRASEFLG